MSAPIEEWLQRRRCKAGNMRITLDPARNARGNLRPARPLSTGELWARLVAESDGLVYEPRAVP